MSTEQDIVDAAYISQANKLKNNAKKEILKKSINGIEIETKEFFKILENYGIKLNLKAENYIKDKWKVSKDNTNFKEALGSININLNEADPIKGEWILRSNQPNKRRDNTNLSLYSYGVTSALSKKSKVMSVDRVIREQQNEINRVK